MIKPIQSDETFNTPFVTNKSWTLSSDEGMQTIEEGSFRNSSHNFFDSESSYRYGFQEEPQNPNGSYKRLLYTVIKNAYYVNDVAKAFGLETTDSDRVIKILQDTFVRVSIPKEYFGEKIQPDSVVINDYSKDKDYVILDDMYGNLYVDGTNFINYTEVTSSL
jgi:hypothetical protein